MLSGDMFWNATSYGSQYCVSPTGFHFKTFDCDGHAINGTYHAGGTVAIEVRRTWASRIVNCVVDGLSESNGMTLVQVEDLVMENVRLVKGGVYAEQMNNAKIAKSTITRTFYVSGERNNVTDCELWDVEYSDWSYWNDPPGAVIRFERNVIHRTLLLEGSAYVLNNNITGNADQRPGFGIDADDTVHFMVIEGNLIENYQYCVMFRDNVDDVVIRDNRIQYCSTKGIQMGYGQNNVLVENNKVLFCGRWGAVDIWGDETEISNVVFENNEICGSVMDIRVSQEEHSEISGSGNACGNVENYLDDDHAAGLPCFQNCEQTFQRELQDECFCSGCGECSQKMTYGCRKITLTDDIIDPPPSEDGSECLFSEFFSYKTLDCANHKIQINQTRGWYTAISIEMSGFGKVENCFVEDGGYGIEVRYSVGMELWNNTVKNSENIGIYLYSADEANIHGNVVENVGTDVVSGSGNGIELYSSNFNQIHENEVRGCDRAIEIDENSDHNLVYDNIFDGSCLWCSDVFSRSTTTNFSLTDPVAWPNICGGNLVGGNAWSEYSGPDDNLDGFGDNPNIIFGTTADHFPLLGCFTDTWVDETGPIVNPGDTSSGPNPGDTSSSGVDDTSGEDTGLGVGVDPTIWGIIGGAVGGVILLLLCLLVVVAICTCVVCALVKKKKNEDYDSGEEEMGDMKM